MIRHRDAKHLNGAHAANVRYLWRQTALAVCEYDFGRLGHVKSQVIVLRPPIYMFQFCRPRVGINSWNYDVGVIGILEHQLGF